MENKKHPLPDKSINEREPQEPNIHPSTGQHEPDIQDERSKKQAWQQTAKKKE